MKPRFPSWRDLSLPDVMPEMFCNMGHGCILNFLLAYRIFFQENKVRYLYLCGSCSSQKGSLTPFETYSECERCSSSDVHALPYHSLSKKNSRSFNRNLASSVCLRMARYHSAYCGLPCPDILEMSWDKDKKCFRTKFLGGDQVYSSDSSLAVFKAALCCPFLWDGRFDFQTLKWKEQSDSLSLSHLFYQLCASF